ncbi:MAG: hypothetical protein K5864_04705 [Bacteroidales bacterium]|nr:hypothetical protein [Bacteroidales bacterium]
MNRKTRRFWLWMGVILLAEVAAITLWCQRRDRVPADEASVAYTRYAGRDDMNVVFFKDFHLNDSIFVDVTLLQSLDSASWATLVYDFHLDYLHPFEPFDTLNERVGIKYAPRGDYRAKMDTANKFNNDLIAISINRRSVMVFRIENKQQDDAIYRYTFRKAKERATERISKTQQQ